jgi:hypothetical protein
VVGVAEPFRPSDRPTDGGRDTGPRSRAGGRAGGRACMHARTARRCAAVGAVARGFTWRRPDRWGAQDANPSGSPTTLLFAIARRATRGGRALAARSFDGRPGTQPHARTRSADRSARPAGSCAWAGAWGSVPRVSTASRSDARWTLHRSIPTYSYLSSEQRFINRRSPVQMLICMILFIRDHVIN